MYMSNLKHARLLEIVYAIENDQLESVGELQEAIGILHQEINDRFLAESNRRIRERESMFKAVELPDYEKGDF